MILQENLKKSIDIILHTFKDNVYHKIVEDFKKKYTDYAPLEFLNKDDEKYIKE